MHRTEKQIRVDRLHEVFSESTAVLLINFTGIGVLQETELRRKVAEIGSYQVVKNTLALRAAQGTPLESLTEQFHGPTAIAFTREDPVGLAKSLKSFFKEHPQMSFKAAVLDSRQLSVEQVNELADLPGREELLAQLIGLMQAPLISLAGALQSPIKQLALGLKQLAEKNKNTGD